MRAFSPAQLSALIGFTPRWITRNFKKEKGKISELDVLGWMNANLANRMDPPFVAVERLLTPNECAVYFPGNSTATGWRYRMNAGWIHRCIRTAAQDWRAPVYDVCKFLAR